MLNVQSLEKARFWEEIPKTGPSFAVRGMKIRYFVFLLCCLIVLSGCAVASRKVGICNALIDRPDLKGLTEQQVEECFGLPENIIPVDSGRAQDETWVYRNKWYGVMSIRIVEGEVVDTGYQYGMLSR